MAGLWKEWKSESSFSTPPTAPWKSRRDGEISPFPQPHAAAHKLKPKTKRKKMTQTTTMHDADADGIPIGGQFCPQPAFKPALRSTDDSSFPLENHHCLPEVDLVARLQLRAPGVTVHFQALPVAHDPDAAFASGRSRREHTSGH